MNKEEFINFINTNACKCYRITNDNIFLDAAVLHGQKELVIDIIKKDNLCYDGMINRACINNNLDIVDILHEKSPISMENIIVEINKLNPITVEHLVHLYKPNDEELKKLIETVENIECSNKWKSLKHKTLSVLIK